MKSLRQIVCLAGAPVIMGVLSASAMASEPSDVAASAQTWFLEVFAKGFIEGDPNFMEYYQEPTYLVIGDESRALSRGDFASAVDEHYVQPWLAAGWETTNVIDLEVKALASDSARVTASWALLDADGKNVMGCSRPQWHYILVRQADEWQVIADIEGDCSD